jgi:hypothetical protein
MIEQNDFDEIKFTSDACGVGFPSSTLAGSNHFVISGMNGRFPSGLGITASLRSPSVVPYSTDFLGGSDRDVDFGVLTTTFEGLKSDPVTGPLLSAYATESDLPDDTCGSQQLRDALQYLGAGAPFIGSFDPYGSNAQLEAGFLFENCEENLRCVGDALRACDLSIYPEVPAEIVSWECA